MGEKNIDITVAGLACLDIVLKDIERSERIARDIFGISESIPPGQLRFIDTIPSGKEELFWQLAKDAIVSTGGIVSNTGGDMHRLGFGNVRLMSTFGQDSIGERVEEIYRAQGYPLESMGRVDESSFTFVALTSSGERSFLHHPLST